MQPGIVAIKFEEGVEVSLAQPGKPLPGATFFVSDSIDLSDFEAYLSSAGLLRVARTFARRSPEEWDELHRRLARQGTRPVPNLNRHFTLFFPEEADTRTIARHLRSFSFISDAVASEVVPPPVEYPDDPQAIDAVTSGQWYLFRTKVSEAWKVSDGSNVVIADCDAGFELTHSDLSGNFLPELQEDFGNPGDDVQDGVYESHGTAVMGILAAMSNSSGIAGAAH
ncbi:MAG: hypothetical protein D6795_04550, partial [Deltaproteobacteria bacterium]